MRKHDVRKWLHAILDLLPVIFIPVFMVYSHRHEINDGSIEVPQQVAVDFNQLVDFDNGYSQDREGEYYSITYEDNFINIHFVSVTQNYYPRLWLVNNGYSVNDKIFIRVPQLQTAGSMGVRGSYNGVISYLNWFNRIVTIDKPYDYIDMYESLMTTSSAFDKSFSVSLFNLTRMFGSGNEPTIEEFNAIFTDVYYPYTLSHKELINNGTIVYNDTDIMSQFTYQLYNSVDKYFNVGNVFHLGEVYDWFNLNIFNGNAPLYIYVVYQIVLYELVMDLLFLLYGLFMWFIDMIQKLMEKPLNSIK